MGPRNTGSTPPPTDLNQLRRELRDAAEPERVPELQRLFKTGPGGYGEGDCDETLRLARVLLDDEHDLIHKAVGWMLREVGKRDEELLVGFLQQHAGDMPRTMQRYAVERLDAPLRAELMAAGRRQTATVGASDPGQNRRSPPSAR